MAECPDCDEIDLGASLHLKDKGNGKCSACHGTGESQAYLDHINEEITGEEPPDCDVCNHTGQCQTCGGTGEVDDDEDVKEEEYDDDRDDVESENSEDESEGEESGDDESEDDEYFATSTQRSRSGFRNGPTNQPSTTGEAAHTQGADKSATRDSSSSWDPEGHPILTFTALYVFFGLCIAWPVYRWEDHGGVAFSLGLVWPLTLAVSVLGESLTNDPQAAAIVSGFKFGVVVMLGVALAMLVVTIAKQARRSGR